MPEGPSSSASGDVESGITPLITQNKKINLSNREIEEVQKCFNDVIDTITVDNIPAKLEEFKGILADGKIKIMEAYYKQNEKNLQNVMPHVPDQKSFLNRFNLQEVLLRMLKDIAKYAEFLKLFIKRFKAHKERIEGKLLLKKDTEMNKSKEQKDKTKKQPRPKTNNDPRTMRELDTPLHCAVRQLNEDFIKWLLEEPETEVNLGNKRRETPLAILCMMFDWSKKRKTEMNAPTHITKLIKSLLVKGADFNIYMNESALPFDFLRKYDTADVDEIIKLYAKSNVAITENPPKQLHGEGKDVSRKRIVKFYKKTEDMDVCVTPELLEIFIYFKDLEKFKHYWTDFQVTSANVKKVVTLLLHVAVERNYTPFVSHIIKKASKEIFKPEENKATQENKQEEIQMVHRNELKGLLKTVCLNGNKALLNMFLQKMNDRLLVNENPLLINTLNGAYTMKQKKDSIFLLDCMEILINNHRKVDMYRVDANGNTALHLALSYGYENLALLMLKRSHGLIGLMNNQYLTPIEYGRRQFWNDYLDKCITVQDRTELKFDVNFLQPPPKKESTESKAKVSCYGNWLSCLPWFKPMNELYNSKYRFTRTVNDMTALRLISQSKDRKEFLMHPVIVAFITMKWERLCHWNILNFWLTSLTMSTFVIYTLLAPGSCKNWSMAGTIIGALILLVREITQWRLRRRFYITLANLVDIINLVLIGAVLGCEYGRGGVCKAVPIVSSFVVVSLSLQATFLLGASWNKLSITLYMFKTVAMSFFKSFLSFTPVIGAFIYSFYRTNNEPADYSATYYSKNDSQNKSAEKNFNNFTTFWNAIIKTLVMTTGEFEAANIDFDGGKWLLFVAFVFVAPIVILNLMNGLAVSDIAAIRQQSEFISIYRKVKLLERFESAVINYGCTTSGCLQRFFRDPWFPGPFFENHESIIYIKTRELNQLKIQKKKGMSSEKCRPRLIPGFFAWLFKWNKNRYFGFFSCKKSLFATLDQLHVDKAMAIVNKRFTINSEETTSPFTADT